MLGEDNALPSSKRAITQHHLQLQWKILSNLEESGSIVVGRSIHGQETITQEDHQGKEVADEGISKLREFPQLLTSGDGISIERVKQGSN